MKGKIWKRILLGFAVFGLCCLFPVGPAFAQNGHHSLHAGNLVYKGAFAFPTDDAWAYSGHALTYYPDGDPSGPSDGFPGSLYVAGHAWNDLVGEITIPGPVKSNSFDDLPRASVLRPLTDITGGLKDDGTYIEGCQYREVDGLAYLPNIHKIAWNLRDWIMFPAMIRTLWDGAILT